MKTVAIIQARMASTRLPGKVLVDIVGQPMLHYVVRRAKQSTTLDLVVVATSKEQSDDPVAHFCEVSNTAFFRGSQDDVLDRYYQAAKHFNASTVVRLTADCPLLDAQVIDKVVEFFRAGEFDYAANILEATYPDGLDTEVFRREALERSWREAKLKSEREHVTSYMRNHPERFRLGNVQHTDDLSALRWTVDEPRDLEFVRAVYSHLGSSPFGLTQVLELLREHPELRGINPGIERNEGYQKSLREDVGETFGGKMSGTGQRLYAKARLRIPGGTQLLSKRPEMFLPEQWPSYFSKAKGVEVWDLDGNKYIDMCYNGIGSCILGAADPDVDAAVKRAVESGSMSTLNCPEEVELADLLCELHPWAEMVRYARCGGEAMALAVRIARAKTGRDKVAFCGYHGWHDWYLAANLADQDALNGHLLAGLDPAGVPRGLKGTALPFRYNQIGELEAIVSKHRADLAAIVMEPIREHEPEPGFLERVRQLATETGAVLILDEVTAGFRLNTGGVHLLYNLVPDIAVFAKAMSNGYAMAAVIGQREVMQAAQNSFISSTYWTERIGPAAALATIRKHQQHAVASHLIQVGQLVKAGWRKAAEQSGLDVHIGGIDPLAHFAFQCGNSQAAHSLFTQLMLERGFLATKSFYATYAHNQKHVESYLAAIDEVFPVIADALENKTVTTMLRGPVAHTGFRRLT